MAPATLAIIVGTFTEPAEWARAVGLWSATAGLGVVMGQLLGGLLAGTLGWRSVVFLNVALVILVVVLARLSDDLLHLHTVPHRNMQPE